LHRTFSRTAPTEEEPPVNIKLSFAYVLIALTTASCVPWLDTKVTSLETHNPKNALVLLDTSIQPAGDEVPEDFWDRQVVTGSRVVIRTGGTKRAGPWLYSVRPGMYLLSLTNDVNDGYWNPTQKILFYVRAGEFVYIGQIAHTNIYRSGESEATQFSIRFLDRYETALAFFRNKYPKSTRTPTKRLPIIVRVSRKRSEQFKFRDRVRALIKGDPERYGYRPDEVRKAP